MAIVDIRFCPLPGVVQLMISIYLRAVIVEQNVVGILADMLIAA